VTQNDKNCWSTPNGKPQKKQNHLETESKKARVVLSQKKLGIPCEMWIRDNHFNKFHSDK